MGERFQQGSPLVGCLACGGIYRRDKLRKDGQTWRCATEGCCGRLWREVREVAWCEFGELSESPVANAGQRAAGVRSPRPSESSLVRTPERGEAGPESAAGVQGAEDLSGSLRPPPPTLKASASATPAASVGFRPLGGPPGGAAKRRAPAEAPAVGNAA